MMVMVKCTRQEVCVNGVIVSSGVCQRFHCRTSSKIKQTQFNIIYYYVYNMTIFYIMHGRIKDILLHLRNTQTDDKIMYYASIRNVIKNN